ncbi:hypothetical protein BDR06DRAFT_420673 [Suillus hirtellus]|nr:hypothetical protein BDR06DRAFT_420673 [Suillus hirtellus]
MPKIYVCSTGGLGCNQTFNKRVDLKRHEAMHPKNKYICTWPGCNFTTLIKKSYGIHSDKHAGKQRHNCPHDDCDFKTHNPSLLTAHRKNVHKHVPLPRSHVARPVIESYEAHSSSQPTVQPLPPAQPLPFGYQYEPRVMQPEPMPPRPMQFHPTQYQYQPGPTQYEAQVMEPGPMPPRPMQFHPTQYQYQPEPTQYEAQVMEPEPMPMQFHPTEYQHQPELAQYEPQVMEPEPIPPRPMQFNPTQYQPELGQYEPQVVKPELIPPRPMRFHPTQYQSKSTQYEPPTPDPKQLLEVIYGSTNAADDYHVHRIRDGPQWMD